MNALPGEHDLNIESEAFLILQDAQRWSCFLFLLDDLIRSLFYFALFFFFFWQSPST